MIKKDLHVTPHISSQLLAESRTKVFERYFAKALEICGFCGLWKVKQVDCPHCNHVIEYTDEFDKLGNPIELWVEKK